MMRKAVDWSVSSVVALLLFFIGMSALPPLMRSIMPMPHIIHDMRIVSAQPVHAGQVVKFSSVITRTEICDAMVYRYVWNEGSNELAFSEPPFPGNRGGLGIEYTLNFSVKMPDDLAPGLYRLDVQVHNDCPSGAVFNTVAPPVSFYVR